MKMSRRMREGERWIMGCDIHMYAEKKVDGRWVKQEGFKNSWSESSDHPYDNRNYKLFGVLADVRNGRGFAGGDIGDRVVPLSMPRGLPEDVSDEIRRKSNEWGRDGHSHSWLLLSEILEADLENFEMKNRAYVKLESFKHFLEHGVPGNWCGGIDGCGIRKISNEAMRLIAEGRDPENVLEFERMEPLNSRHSFDLVDVASMYFPEKLQKIADLKSLVSHESTPKEEAENAQRKLDALKARAIEISVNRLYTRLEWISKGIDSFGEFIRDAVPQLVARSSASRALNGKSEKGDALATTKPDPKAYDDVRIVFWFDN